jgi:ethanolamine ammonia-lyase small subunit
MLVNDRWANLRGLTSARIALGHSGTALPTSEILNFRLQHAQARDAVHVAMDGAVVAREVSALGFETLHLRSAAPNRETYLRRPDLGRRLVDGERIARGVFDVAFVIGDGLSALAIHRHAAALLATLAPELGNWRIAPVGIVEEARVAIGDEVGSRVGADLVVVLIGERPGLSSPDSLGVYLTWNPLPGRTDAERNCISNIRDGGLSYAAAAQKLLFLMTEARRRKLSGVNLKEAAGQTLRS